MRLAYFLFFVVFVNFGCSQKLEISSDDSSQPYVVSMIPSDGSIISSLDSIQVVLSHPIDPNSVDPLSFIITLTGSEDLSILSATDIQDQIEDGEIVSLEGFYSLSEDGTEISWIPSSPLEPLQTYEVILTSTIQTNDHVPLSQTPEEGNTFFISHFMLLGFFNEVEVEEEQSSTSDDSTSNTNDVQETTTVLIHEIFYDTTETEEDGHLFIELYGTPGASLYGYTVRMINGSNGENTEEIVLQEEAIIPDDGFFVIADLKTGSDEETYVESADYLENFDPQNGPDSIGLFNSYGELLDVVGYGEGMVEFDSEENILYESMPASDVESGFSLSRVNMIDSNNNSVDFVKNLTPSPGLSDVEEESVEISADSSLSDTPDSSDQSDVSDMPEESEESELSNKVHFTEVVVDPQQDWNDSSGGNGSPFDVTPGDGTVGTTDEWIEIKNGTENSVDITSWTLEMVDGTDVSALFSSTEADLIFSLEGTWENFGSDEFLIIGNPDGDMKNTVTLRLLDDEYELIDELDIEDGNATGVENESFSLSDDEIWELGPASIGE